MITNTSDADPSLSTIASIQIVDDNPQNLAALAAILTAQGYEVRTAISGALALQSTRKHLPDLILLDTNMPEMDGYQVCERLKANERTRDVPVIFFTSDEAMGKVKAFFVGGVDHITKPFQEQEVLCLYARLRFALFRNSGTYLFSRCQTDERGHDFRALASGQTWSSPSSGSARLSRF